MLCAAGGWTAFNAVDIFNVIECTWSTAVLSLPRAMIAATSLPNLGIAIFAGGRGMCCDAYLSSCMVPLLCERVGCVGGVHYFCVDDVFISHDLRRY